MHLRSLEQKDAARMLEWMHDSFVVEKLQTDFAKKTMSDCKTFIANSQDNENIHLAITDDHDEYMGTVSLKHITEDTAEFAITLHKDAMGKGYSTWAMNEILKKGFTEYKVTKIYWCVAPDNARALNFYDKKKFSRIDSENVKIAGGYTQEQIKEYVWYQVSAYEFEMLNTVTF